MNKLTLSPNVAMAYDIVEKAKSKRLAQIKLTNKTLDGRIIRDKHGEYLHFGSSGYLGLEFHQDLIEGAKDAIDQYGTQFSCSRAYISIPLYEELEDLFHQIFAYPSIVLPTTTLGHISNIPLLVGSKDVIILDHLVHNSVQNASKLAKVNGTHIELLRHNNMNILERKIKKLQDKYERIWYMCDSVYSMQGDFAPLKEITTLLDKYSNFYAYVDDAHGMSWAGENGAGYALSQIAYHEKMILITSLSKGFASGGSALIFPNEEVRKLIRNLGSTYIFSNPIPPSVLGASVACAKIHLSEKIDLYQKELMERVDYFIERAAYYDLFLPNKTRSPIFLIGLGKVEIGFKLCQHLKEIGFYTNLAMYPSAPINKTGLRVTVNRHLNFEDIDNLLKNIKELLDLYMREENFSKEKIIAAFSK